MPEKKEEKQKSIDRRLARLLGGISGLAASESQIVPGIFAKPLGALLEVGIEPYNELSHDLPLWLTDIETASDAKHIRAALKAPKVPFLSGPEHQAMSPQAIKTISSHPYLLPIPEEELIELRMRGPRIFVKSPNLAAISHEIGHTVPSAISRASTLTRSPFLRLLSLGSGVGLGLSDNETAQSIAPLVSGSAHIPELLEELRASSHGLRGIYAIKGGKEALLAAGRMLPAFLTYVLGATPAFAAPVIAKAVSDYAHEKSAGDIKGGTGALRNTAQKAWSTPEPKPKSAKPALNKMTPDIPPSSKPPSKAKFYKDIQESIKNPNRGWRYTT